MEWANIIWNRVNQITGVVVPVKAQVRWLGCDQLSRTREPHRFRGVGTNRFVYPW